jgi:hypothetical protein
MHPIEPTQTDDVIDAGYPETTRNTACHLHHHHNNTGMSTVQVPGTGICLIDAEYPETIRAVARHLRRRAGDHSDITMCIVLVIDVFDAENWETTPTVAREYLPRTAAVPWDIVPVPGTCVPIDAACPIMTWIVASDMLTDQHVPHTEQCACLRGATTVTAADRNAVTHIEDAVPLPGTCIPSFDAEYPETTLTDVHNLCRAAARNTVTRIVAVGPFIPKLRSIDAEYSGTARTVARDLHQAAD